jgi:hypothetical protein
MTKKQMIKISIVAVCSLVAFAGSANALVVVNVDLQYWADVSHVVYSGTAAAPDAGTVWNEHVHGTSITEALDSSGSPTSIDVAIEAGNAVAANAHSGNALLNDWFFNNTGVAKAITISDLSPNTDYTLYMYGNETNQFGQSEGCRFTFGAVTQTALGAQAVLIPPNPWVLGKDHVIFNVTSDAVGQIVGTWAGDGAYNRFNGMQIVEVPEPVTMSLLGLGALGMLRRKRS